MIPVPKRPVLRWHGGKWKLAPWITQHFPCHHVYCEPYCGAASVLIRKPRSYGEYLNDLDGEVINLFRVLQDEKTAEALVNKLWLTPFSRQEFDLAYEPSDCAVERARRLCIRSFMGFSSSGFNAGNRTGFRSRSFRSRVSPAWDWRNYPDSLWTVAERLRGVCVERRPALEVIERLDTAETLFYVDPPYPESARVNFGAYAHEMSDQDHRELAATLRACSGYVVLSGYLTDLYDELYPDWTRIEKRTFADHGERVESLWLSPRTWGALAADKVPFQMHLKLEAS